MTGYTHDSDGFEGAEEFAATGLDPAELRLQQDSDLTREAPVWLVDDDPAVRESLAQWLELAEIHLRCFSRAEALLEALAAAEPVSVVISDIRMPGMDGLTLLARLALQAPELPVLMMTGHGDVATAVAAMQGGARDFIEKPFDPEALELKLRQALAGRRLSDENQRLRRRLSVRGLSGLLRGESRQIRQLRERLLELRGHPARVWISGEAGSGRSTLALALAEHAPPADASASSAAMSTAATALLARVECAPLSQARAEGAEALASAIEDALAARPAANTLLLHEVDHLSGAQWQWLDGWIAAREDGARQAPRLVCSAQCSVGDVMASGPLTRTLGHALAEIELTTPALRERREDIPLLMAHFSRQAAEVHEVEVQPFASGELAALMAADWPGNLWQLRQAASRRVVLGELPTTRQSSAPGNASAEEDAGEVGNGASDEALANSEEHGLAAQVAMFESTLIRAALIRARGNIAQVLEELALPRRTLNLKMHKYGLRREDFRHGHDDSAN
ncbi:sigma-54-dependent transcriptional regulator [Cobetia sp. Ld8]|uniref:sigma-54-dependent transcriptional regulator n=1 Tax=Cobetia sp. Ld8 TaxID=649154 RepID=UPI00386CF6AC